jgi:predicted metal-dependent hydrolase
LSEFLWLHSSSATLASGPVQPSAQLQLSPSLDVLPLASNSIPVQYVRHRRARRYTLRVTRQGAVRITLPRWGSKREAFSFAQTQHGWIEKQLETRATAQTKPWTEGTEVWVHGERFPIRVDDGFIRLGSETIRCTPSDDLRPAILGHLHQLAGKELVARTLEFAAMHGLKVARVVIRDQKTRWGSCSRRGSISLNWRLIQVPASVSDYIIIHELMHLREMNHSRRFWKHVESACPQYRDAERWLRKHSREFY